MTYVSPVACQATGPRIVTGLISFSQGPEEEQDPTRQMEVSTPEMHPCGNFLCQDTVPLPGRLSAEAHHQPPHQPPLTTQQSQPVNPPLNYRSLETKFPDVLKVACNYPLYDKSQSDDNINVKGRLKERKEFWYNIGASPMIMSIIENGYRIYFTCAPHP